MHGVSDSGPFDDDDLPEGFDFSNLFGGMGNDPNAMMASFMSLFGGGLPGASGGLDQATQLAVAIASGGQAEANVDPTVRMSPWPPRSWTMSSAVIRRWRCSSSSSRRCAR